MLASESVNRVGLHVAEDVVVLEVVDELGLPVPPGTPGYKVLVTSLIGRTVPLIRYELADSVTLAAGRIRAAAPTGGSSGSTDATTTSSRSRPNAAARW